MEAGRGTGARWKGTGMDARRVRRALRAAGVGQSALCGLRWPFGRKKRMLSLVRKRLAVLEAKNEVVDFLFRTQRSLAGLGLVGLEQVRAALGEAEKRRLILTAGASRTMLEEELSARHGSEAGRALDQALAELAAEGVVLRVPGAMMLANHDVYLAVLERGRPQYDVSELSRLVWEGRQYAQELRRRVRREKATGRERTYRL